MTTQDRAAPRTEAGKRLLNYLNAERPLSRDEKRLGYGFGTGTAPSDPMLDIILNIEREAAAPGAAALDRIEELETALQQDANLIHYGRHTKYPEEHSERFEDCAFLRCVARRTLLTARAAEPKPPEPRDVSQVGPCIFPECVSRDRHWHGGFPGGYDNPADPEGPPIEFTREPDPGVRDYNGALLAPPHNAPQAGYTGPGATQQPETDSDTPTRLSAAPDGAETATGT